MSKNSLALVRARSEFDRLLSEPENFPIRFTYRDTVYHGFSDLDRIENVIKDTADGQEFSMKFLLDEFCSVGAYGKYCAEFGEYEYTLYFENNGTAPSGVISDVYCLDTVFSGADGMLRGILGDHDNFYQGYQHPLSEKEIFFESDIGRATHIVFPYFDLVHGNGGSLIALGWAGTWNARFTDTADGAAVRAKTCINFQTVLLPGESLRSGLVVILPYESRDEYNATNLWREWFLKYNLPRANANKDSIQPFTTMGFFNDTGLPNSDGSISERSFTWRPSLEKMLEKDIHPDFRWFDAGWYFDPAGNTVESLWWHTVGSWELDTIKWPGNSFRESVDVFHQHGIKTLVWFEPERVTMPEELEKNYGYKPEWGLYANDKVTNNIGDPECLDWTYGRIEKMMRENDIDLYREDNNSDPAGSWALIDQREYEKHQLPRNGVGETKAICGHYELWDRILTFCGKTGKCTFLDSCASGGGRNDIESMRRSVPFLRSDYDRTTSGMRLSQTSSFCKWIPFNGSSTKETEGQLESEAGKGASPYVSRASFLPIMNYVLQFVHNPDFDYALFHRNLNEWHSIKHLLTKDFYALTPWHHHEDLSGWTVFAYDDPQLGDSVLLAFRMEECAEENHTVKLPFAQSDAVYTLTDADTGISVQKNGTALADGIVLKLDQPKTSLLLRIKRQ